MFLFFGYDMVCTQAHVTLYHIPQPSQIQFSEMDRLNSNVADKDVYPGCLGVGIDNEAAEMKP